MLHPVGPLPARVYWRRRLVVLALLLAVLGGAATGAVLLVSGRTASGGETTTPAAGARGTAPALERVVPSLTAVRTPDPAPPAGEATVAAEPEAVAAPVAEPGPVPGGPCTDDMLAIEVRTPGSAAVGSKPTFELVITNASVVACSRPLDKGLQELILLDAAGARVWGSNDCFPEASTDLRSLAPGEVVVFPVVWGGLTSEPTCTAARTNPPPGNYVVRGRLDTKSSPDAAFALT